jgi:hypothetical protein
MNENFENDDATENYYERGKYGCWNFHVTKKTSLYIESSKVALVLSTHACYSVLL